MNKETKTLTIAVDAMGGDNAPDEIVAGAVKASQGEGINIALIGDHKLVSEELDKHDTNGLPIQIVPSDGVILEGESPTVAFRQKPESSILVSTGLVKKRNCRCFSNHGLDRSSNGSRSFNPWSN